MKIVHFSDPHAGGPAGEWRAYFDKRWVGVFNYTFRRRFQVNLQLLERAVKYILDTKPDVAVCTGDLTSTGQPGEFNKIRPLLQPLRDSGIPVLYLPGNHDCYVRRPHCVEAMHAMVEWLTRGRYRFDDLPLAIELGGAEFLAVNCSYPSNLLCSWGRLRKTDGEWLKRYCAEHPHDKPRIFLSHYPLIEAHPFLRLRHGLLFGAPARELLKSGELDLSLCGHVHRPHRSVDETGRGENCAGSVTMNGSVTVIECDTAARRFTFDTVSV